MKRFFTNLYKNLCEKVLCFGKSQPLAKCKKTCQVKVKAIKVVLDTSPSHTLNVVFELAACFLMSKKQAGSGSLKIGLPTFFYQQEAQKSVSEKLEKQASGKPRK